MKKLFKSLACISLVFILSLSIVSATDGTGSGGMLAANYIIEDIVIDKIIIK